MPIPNDIKGAFHADAEEHLKTLIVRGSWEAFRWDAQDAIWCWPHHGWFFLLVASLPLLHLNIVYDADASSNGHRYRPVPL